MASMTTNRHKTILGFVEARNYEAVVRTARDMLKRTPADHYLLKALSFGLIGTSCHQEALPVLERAIRLYPGDPELYNNMGICLSEEMRWSESLQFFDKALAINPADPELWKNKGAAYYLMNCWSEALPCLAKAIELFPGDYDEAIEQMAGAFLNSGRDLEAYACYSQLYDEYPDNSFYLANLIRAGLRLCDWNDLDARILRLRDMSSFFYEGIFGSLFTMGMPGVTQKEQCDIAKARCLTRFPRRLMNAPFLKARRSRNDPPLSRRIRVGYVSYDFRNHPVGFVLPQIIELHDRNRFEIFAYSLCPDDGSDIRKRLVCVFDHFHDISEMSVAASAKYILADDIDILVDLQGWTAGDRAALFAMRPAPIQVNWLGFAGSVGSDRLADFLIADPVVIPPENDALFSERVVRLPNCYLPMDATRPVGLPPSREAAGLPVSGFVFCSMNNSYKFNPQVFDVWCRILDQTPGSFLWLTRPSGRGDENLLREAAARGIASERIIFAPFVQSRAEHLARLQLADLALDPSPYNSHSTGIDLLWAGVPMITLLGDTFSGRVGASLLLAAGLPECIANTWDDYERLCIDLFRNPVRFQDLRRRLLESHSHAPLFDMKRFVAGLDQLYLDMLHTPLSA